MYTCMCVPLAFPLLWWSFWLSEVTNDTILSNLDISNKKERGGEEKRKKDKTQTNHEEKTFRKGKMLWHIFFIHM